MKRRCDCGGGGGGTSGWRGRCLAGRAALGGSPAPYLLRRGCSMGALDATELCGVLGPAQGGGSCVVWVSGRVCCAAAGGVPCGPCSSVGSAPGSVWGEGTGLVPEPA